MNIEESPVSLADAATARDTGALMLDAEALYGELAHSIRMLFKPGMKLMGVTSGGAWLAQRLQLDLALSEPVGIISSAMHRDDFARRGMTAAAQNASHARCFHAQHRRGETARPPPAHRAAIP